MEAAIEVQKKGLKIYVNVPSLPLQPQLPKSNLSASKGLSRNWRYHSRGW